MQRDEGSPMITNSLGDDEAGDCVYNSPDADATERGAEWLLREEYLSRRHGVAISSSLGIGFIFDRHVDASAIDAAMQRVVCHHQALRTTFVPAAEQGDHIRL